MEFEDNLAIIYLWMCELKLKLEWGSLHLNLQGHVARVKESYVIMFGVKLLAINCFFVSFHILYSLLFCSMILAYSNDA